MNIIIGILLGMMIPAAGFIGFCWGVGMAKKEMMKKVKDDGRY